jgi:hypothetical protein
MWGRQLTYTPATAITDGEEHVLMPYRNSVNEGFISYDATGFKLTANGKTALTAPGGAVNAETACDNPWDVFQHGSGTDDSATAANNVYSWITEERPLVLSRYGTSYIPQNRNYPRMKDGIDTNHFVTYTGTSTDVATYAVWMWRRI